MVWDGIERRSDVHVCSLHNQMVSKLDQLLEGQTRLKDVIENGLKSTVAETQEHVADIRDKVEILHANIESFSWFQTWVTDMRNNLFKNVLKFGFLAIVFWFIVNFGNQSISILLKRLGG